MGSDLSLILLAVTLVAVAGAFAAMEASISRLSRSKVDELARSGRRLGVKLREIADDTPRYLNIALLLRLICELMATALVAVVALGEIDNKWGAVGLTAGVMVVVSYVVVGVSPRTVGRQHAGAVGLVAAAVLPPLATALGPLPKGLILLGNAVTPGKGFREGPFASEAELRDLVDLAAEESMVIEDDERRMVHSVFELGDTIVREVMVPRTEMVFIEQTKTLRQALSLALRSGFSRIPVVGEGEDDIVGVVYLKDVVRRVHWDRDAESLPVSNVMRQAIFVPDSKAVDALLKEMQLTQSHIAILVDEYGGTAGLVTMEDLVEEIVGEIADEYDRERPPVERLDDGAVRVIARLPVEELGEVFEREIADDEVETVGGLLAKHLGRVPIPGAEVVVEGLRLHAESVGGRRNRITTVLVTVEPEPDPEGSDEGAAVAEHEHA
ncbi:hemolysin family protein [Sporichthya polymorpha]|uniref:hemolysin family protein n=1 Tax=Sporichthya polymorpha TaxID=35751 RepID=UPI0003693061|nr:hemolysin family protein [Sporichthya polymorpha]